MHMSKETVVKLMRENIADRHHPFKRLACFQNAELDTEHAIKILHAEARANHIFSPDFEKVDAHILNYICEQWLVIEQMSNSKKSVMLTIDVDSKRTSTYMIDVWIKLTNCIDFDTLLVQMKLMEYEPKFMNNENTWIHL